MTTPPVTDITTTGTASDTLLQEIESAVEAGVEAAVKQYVTTKFGATASADALKLMQDIIALAAKPGLSASVADLPDVLALVMALEAGKPSETTSIEPVV